MQISVIGTGYVGLVTGACFAEFGVNVLCMDNDEKRIARLEKGEVPFYEPGIIELVAKGIGQNRLTFTTKITRAVDHGEVILSQSAHLQRKMDPLISLLLKKWAAASPTR